MWKDPQSTAPSSQLSLFSTSWLLVLENSSRGFFLFVVGSEPANRAARFCFRKDVDRSVSTFMDMGLV